jgi:hypothetical protein
MLQGRSRLLSPVLPFSFENCHTPNLKYTPARTPTGSNMAYDMLAKKTKNGWI